MTCISHKKTKILAPVGGREQLLAAVRCGADAVYLGAKGFNARRNAENFEETSLDEAVAYSHERDVLVYVTLNTLVMDGEFDALTAELDSIARSQADAVIVQDMGVARLVHERYPSLPLFASTQTTVHNCEGAKLLKEQGFSQVVLAREISLDELRTIRASSDIDLEFFVHGALCMCMSGSCYLSAMIGGRSGNRGLCAQPCRLDFRLGARAHALSLKDMSLIERMDDLIDAGVDALKIEGRMKRPEYVAAAVSACCAVRGGKKPDMEALRAVFSRSGFTDGYFTAKRGAHIFGFRTKEDVVSAASVLPRLAAMYSSEPPKVPLTLRFFASSGAPVALEVSDGTHSVRVEGAIPEAARTVPLTEGSAGKPLSQTGGTPYYIDKAYYKIDDGLSLPLAVIKGMRRDALQELARLRTVREPYPCTGAAPHALAAHSVEKAPELRLRFANGEQLFDADGVSKIILPVETIEKAPELINAFGARLVAEPPSLCFPEDMPRLRQTLTALREKGLTAVTADNLGMIYLARELGFETHGDASLNILNSQSLDVFKSLGLKDATVSFELSMKGIEALRGTLPRGLIAYGYLTLMKMRACPAQGEGGCGSCTGRNVLTDEKNERFPLVCRNRRYTELLNCVPLYIGDKPIAKVDFLALRFTTETRAEARAVFDSFLHRASIEGRRTGGLYYRTLL